MGTPLINARTTLVRPIRRHTWYKKVSLWPLRMVLWLSVYILSFCFTFLPLVMGSAILFSQVQIYFQDRHWYEFSVLDVATQTVDPKLSMALREPLLSSCAQVSGDSIRIPRAHGASLIPDSDMEVGSHPKASCVQSIAWIAWLDEPTSRRGIHMILVPLMGVLSVPVVLFATGLFTRHFFSKLRKTLDQKPAADSHQSR